MTSINAVVFAPNPLDLPAGTDWKILLLELFPDIDPIQETPELVVLSGTKPEFDKMAAVLPMLRWVYDMKGTEDGL